MDSDTARTLTTAVDTPLLEVPTEFAHTDDFQSLRNKPPNEHALCELEGYKDIDWTRLKDYQIPSDDWKKISGIYNYGWRLWHVSSGEYYWLCKQCHVRKRTINGSLKPPVFKVSDSTTAAINHLKKVHNIDQKGTEQKQYPGPLDNWTGNGSSQAAAIHNAFAAGFDHNHFRALLFDWIISDNVAFRQLDSDKLRQLLIYLNPRCAPFVPCRTSTSRTVAKIHDKSVGVITETLATSITKINLSFDLWTSGNKLALLGLCAHFIDKNGNPITTLLALPRQTGRHTGLRIADTVSAIIAAYNLEDKIGYFTTDNASSNETCMKQLANEHGFICEERWIRCCGHILNLVGQAALFGYDEQVFSDDINQMELEEQQLAVWRRKGPIGKLHNVIHWINRSPQRCERFTTFQMELIQPTKPDDKQDTYQLVTDVTTRWNSFYYSAKRAVYLRAAIDAIMDEEQAIYDKQIRQAELRGRSNQPKRPAILDDVLSTADWSVINEYLEILKPLKEATLQLEGYIGGKFGSIWQVLPVFEGLLRHFEQQAQRYPVKASLRPMDIHLQPPLGFRRRPADDVATQLTAVPDEQLTAEDHFSINVDLAWQKLNQYYSKLDNSPVYVATVVLHPCHKWRWLEKRWKERPDWLVNARQAFTKLLNQYRYYEPPEDLYSPAKRQRTAPNVIIDRESSEDEQEPLDIDQQMADYKRDIHYKHLVNDKTTSPIKYWLDKRQYWPQLAALALDLYSIPLMSDEPERVFSTTGAAVTPRRRSLLDGTINNLMVVKAWLKARLIRLDRYVHSLTY